MAQEKKSDGKKKPTKKPAAKKSAPKNATPKKPAAHTSPAPDEPQEKAVVADIVAGDMGNVEARPIVQEM